MSKIMNEGYKMEVEKSCWQSLKTKLFWFNLTLLTKIAYVNTTAGFPPPPPHSKETLQPWYLTFDFKIQFQQHSVFLQGWAWDQMSCQNHQVQIPGPTLRLQLLQYRWLFNIDDFSVLWLQQSTRSGATCEPVKAKYSFSHWPVKNFHPRTSILFSRLTQAPLSGSPSFKGLACVPPWAEAARARWVTYRIGSWLAPGWLSAALVLATSITLVTFTSWVSLCILEHGQNKLLVEFLSLNI